MLDITQLQETASAKPIQTYAVKGIPQQPLEMMFDGITRPDRPFTSNRVHRFLDSQFRLPFLCCSWINLGHACASEIQPHSDNTTFLDIFDYAPFNSTTGPCKAGFTSINSGEHGNLQLKAKGLQLVSSLHLNLDSLHALTLICFSGPPLCML